MNTLPRHRMSAWAAIAASLLLLSVTRAEDPVSYRVAFEGDGAKQISVRITLPRAVKGSRVLVMPRAIPMGYGEQHYDRFVEDVNAFSVAGAALPVEREAGPRWRLGRDDATVGHVEYAVDVARMEHEIVAASDASKIRAGYLGLLGYSALAFIEGFEEHPIKLDVEVPGDWPVLSTLGPTTPAPLGKTSASAANYYALADSQIVAGPKASFRKLDAAAPLYLALYSEGDVDEALLGRLVAETMDQTIEYFGSTPFRHFTAHYEFLRPLSERHRYGFSMEHMDSATFYLSADSGIVSTSDAARLQRTRYNLAHHFAHAWIPKRACGEGYFPFTWELTPLIDTIWFSEGFVQYAAISIITAGLPPADAAPIRERILESRFRRPLAEAPAFIRRMSLVELSRVASTRYAEDFRTGRNVFSRGALMAAEMDDRIKEQTGGEKSLRDALRQLMTWSDRNKRGFKISELPRIIRTATGVDTSDILARWMKPLEN